MSEQVLSSASRGPECPSCGVEFDKHDGFATMCGKLQASPAWHDRPTGPGLWVEEDTRDAWKIEPHHMDQPLIQNWSFGRVYGPIPADKVAK